jgi:hypothetical protein
MALRIVAYDADELFVVDGSAGLVPDIAGDGCQCGQDVAIGRLAVICRFQNRQRILWAAAAMVRPVTELIAQSIVASSMAIDTRR